MHISLVLVGMSVCGKLCFKQGLRVCVSNTDSMSKISSLCVDDVATCVNHDFWLDVLTFVHWPNAVIKDCFDHSCPGVALY